MRHDALPHELALGPVLQTLAQVAEERPCVRAVDQPVVVYDHRLIDGAYAGSFLRDLRERLENWSEG